MLYFLEDKAQCVGCEACKNICPHGAIEMQRDEEGFEYPVASDLCTHCGLCERVCPLKNPADLEQVVGSFRIPPQPVKALTRDPEVWMKTSSGGAFYEICRAMPFDTVFFGASMVFPEVRHIQVDFSGVDRILGSKYIQSSMGSTFREVKNTLFVGDYVVFAGTPCQVAGLLCFLGRRPENLLCIEFICHGNGSPLVFERFISEYEQKINQKVVDYKFREKFLDRYPRGFTSKFQYADGTPECIEMDGYNQLFLSQLCLRPCCGENCYYRTQLRNADITLADLKGETMAGDEGVQRNASSIVINTKAGEAVMEQVRQQMIVEPYSLERLIEVNPLFDHTTPSNPKRDDFFKKFSMGWSVHKLVRVFVSRQKFRKKIRHLPTRIIRKAISMFRLL